MKYIELHVRTALIVHGHYFNNQIIEEHVNEEVFVQKLVAVERIQSICEQYILVNSSHDRVMYWEYKGTLDELKRKLAAYDLLIK